MASENLESFYYSVQQYGRYYVINKIIKRDQLPIEGDTTETRALSKGQVVAQYLYPINNSYVQSIVNEITEEDETFYVFGLLLINSLSRGTFVFSAKGIENGDYIDLNTGESFTYETLLNLFVMGGRPVFPGDGTAVLPGDGIKYTGDETGTANA